MNGSEQDDGDLRERLAVLERRLAQLEAQLQALDESFVRHQGQQEGDRERLERAIASAEQRVDEHEWRQHR